MNIYDRKKFGKYFGIIFVLVLIPIIIITFYAISVQEDKTVDKDYYDLYNYQYQVMSQFSKVSGDVYIFENVVDNSDYFMSIGTENESMVKNRLTDLFVEILEDKSIYSQIRLLDTSGNELIRVNNSKEIEIIDQDELQNKSNRDYFTEAIKLPVDSIYISKIDLNVEGGEIEYVDGEPIPTIRFASPVYEDGEIMGIVVINVLADHILNITNKLEYNILNNIEVVNNDGYYLVSNDHSTFGFEFDNDENYEKFSDFELNEKCGFNYYEINGITYSSYYLCVDEIENFVSNDLMSNINISSAESGLYFTSSIDFDALGVYDLSYLFLFFSVFLDLVISFVISKLMDSNTKFYQENLSFVEKNSNYDFLTNLGNRFKLKKYMISLLQQKEIFSVLFLDLDGFKAVNDTYGHDVGDLALIEVANRYQKSVRKNDKVFRLGGDEFVIVLIGCDDKKVISGICKQIIDNISSEMVLDNNHCSVGVSIGVTISDGLTDYDTLLIQADQAMYNIKNTTKNGYSFFEETK